MAVSSRECSPLSKLYQLHLIAWLRSLPGVRVIEVWIGSPTEISLDGVSRETPHTADFSAREFSSGSEPIYGIQRDAKQFGNFCASQHLRCHAATLSWAIEKKLCRVFFIQR